jgi:tRNA 2-thiouridine synthesizing protein A
MDRQAGKKNAMDAPRQVDARGLRCPLPALRLARAVREQGPGSYLLLAEDPAAQADIPALCAERGWVLVEAGADSFMVAVGPAS